VSDTLSACVLLVACMCTPLGAREALSLTLGTRETLILGPEYESGPLGPERP